MLLSALGGASGLRVIGVTCVGGLKPVFLQHQRLQRVSRQAGMATQSATSTIKAPADGDFYKYGLKPVLGEGIMEATLKRLGTVEIKEMDKSNFVKPKSVMYELDGQRRRWDMISSHSSVGVIIYHTQLDALIVVRQFRPPEDQLTTYVQYTAQRLVCLTTQFASSSALRIDPGSEAPASQGQLASAMMLAEEAGEAEPPLSVGFTYELCAGIIDKKKSLAQIAAEEVKEECGFEVAPEKLQWVTQYVSAVGTGGSRHDMYYAEVDESMRVGKGGGLENTGERIEVLALPLDESRGFTEDPSYPKSAGLLFGLMWLRAYIAAKKQLPAKHVV
ncbi:TPA: Nudix hydrolase 14, chloroplastic [Trebouxia sp. C0006]